MMKRKLYTDLLDWFKNNHKQSLLIKGTRQAGKTFLKFFGEKEF